MPIVVQKYGGSSVSDVAKIRRVAERVGEKRAAGYQLVVVVSAMGDTTDELLALAKKISPNPHRRELDMLLTCGERISMALLSMALHELGVPAISFTGSQSGIITDDNHAQARIIEVRPLRIREELERGKVVIVAGYQGVSTKREVTTLGRGGSDTTAVALAAALEAEACEIYSDVDGVYSADPRVVPDARKLEALSYDEMQELAHAGARVLNAQAVEFAKRQGIVIHAKTAHGEGTGSRVQAGAQEQAAARAPRVKAVTGDAGLAVLFVKGEAAVTATFGLLSSHGCKPRLLSREGEGHDARAVVLLPLQDVHGKEALKAELDRALGGRGRWEEGLGSVTCVGEGVGADWAVVEAVLALAKAAGAPPRALHTSPLQVTAVVEKDKVHELTRALHARLVGSS